MDDNLFEQIQQFVVSERWKYNFPLTMQTTLEGDLRITGDDADEFLIAFGEKFNVDVSEFDSAAYFGGEGGLAGWRKLPTPGKIPLTLGALYQSALTGEMYETDSFKRVIRFAKDEKWGLKGPFCRNTTLYRDLRLQGDKARKFIEAFGEEFKIDVSGFDYNKYFGPPKIKILPARFDYMLLKKITLGDLGKAMIE